ncbi:S41 family peptidase [Sphingobacterium oryzagri]|uniref:S41 family peptidase n=1 Tax=Sphingobacterium oryzagri TaxID=3025669 RepID=A0ABY7WDN8_9SPHI|nr:S41 family peptidase [Sphingobacterium sp. KACC 22765]WDF66990.1 S41 family peptidase [Sphingobacterium sp. KACC 22765]
MCRILRRAIAACIVVLFIACEKERDANPQNPETLVAVFDQFYQMMEERYVFWDLDTTNWSEKLAYRDQFVSLDINNTTDKITASNLFREITASLLDHHYSIRFQAAGITGISINPARSRKVSQGLLQNANSYPAMLALLQAPFYDVTFGDNIRFVTGKLNAQTLLLKTNQFQFTRNQNHTALEAALQWFLQEANHPEIKHVVLDLRGCVGGDVVDLGLIMGALVKDDFTFGYTKYKENRAPLRYSPLLPAQLHSNRTDKASVPQIIVLTDTQTASLAEMIAYIVQSQALGVVIGQKTYGAFSPISDTDVFYSGDLVIGDFMTVRTASVQFLGINKESLEGIGLEPTVLTNDALHVLRDYIK